MGAWSANCFGNDEALDWLNDLIDEHDIYFIHNTLEIIADLPSTEKPDTWDCVCALAAAEMVAAAHGRPGPELPVEASEWLDAYDFAADEEAMNLARKVVDRVERDSELRDVWEEVGKSADWLASLADLKARLAA
jgi:hypothetical protein